MGETRKLAAILVADVVGYSRFARRTRIAPFRASGAAQRSDRSRHRRHHGRIVKGPGDGSLIEFRSVVDAVRMSRRRPDNASSTHLTIGNRANRRLPQCTYKFSEIFGGRI